jgi:phosphoenolpyruvate-protein kinase (PTS system EI component)
MAPSSLPRVKQRLRMLSIAEATRFASQVMGQSDERRIATLLEY